MSSQWVQQELFFLLFMVSHRKEIQSLECVLKYNICVHVCDDNDDYVDFVKEVWLQSILSPMPPLPPMTPPRLSLGPIVCPSRNLHLEILHQEILHHEIYM